MAYAAIISLGMRSVPMAKCSRERWVCAPQSLLAGTDNSPMESFSTRMSALLIASSALFAFVWYVSWFPNIGLELAAQYILVYHQRLSVSNRLSSHGHPNQPAELTRLRKWRKKARLLVLLCGQL